jgi:hypothetical protein
MSRAKRYYVRHLAVVTAIGVYRYSKHQETQGSRLVLGPRAVQNVAKAYITSPIYKILVTCHYCSLPDPLLVTTESLLACARCKRISPRTRLKSMQITYRGRCLTYRPYANYLGKYPGFSPRKHASALVLRRC